MESADNLSSLLDDNFDGNKVVIALDEDLDQAGEVAAEDMSQVVPPLQDWDLTQLLDAVPKQDRRFQQPPNYSLHPKPKQKGKPTQDVRRPSLPKPFQVLENGDFLHKPANPIPITADPLPSLVFNPTPPNNPSLVNPTRTSPKMEFSSEEWSRVPVVVQEALRTLHNELTDERERNQRLRDTNQHLEAKVWQLSKRMDVWERAQELQQIGTTGTTSPKRQEKNKHAFGDPAVLAEYLEKSTSHLDTLFTQVQNLTETLDAELAVLRERLVPLENQQGIGEDIEVISPRIRQLVAEQVSHKVDESVLEELMRHIVTRQELKKSLEKQSQKLATETFSGLTESLLEERMKQWSMETYRDYLENAPESLRLRSREILDDVRRELVRPLEDRLERKLTHYAKTMMMPDTREELLAGKVPEREYQDAPLSEDIPTAPQQSFETSNPALTTTTGTTLARQLSQQLSKEFDEKLFLLSTEFDQWRSQQLSQLRHAPSAHRHTAAQWRWTSGTLKFGANVPWNEQTSNTDPTLFRWSTGTSVIRVSEAGLYEITFAFFSKTKPTLHVLVNEASVMSAIHSPSYVVRHPSSVNGGGAANGSGDGKGKQLAADTGVTGCSLMDFLLLPAESTVTINYFGKPRDALGFLALRRL